MCEIYEMYGHAETACRKHAKPCDPPAGFVDAVTAAITGAAHAATSPSRDTNKFSTRNP